MKDVCLRKPLISDISILLVSLWEAHYKHAQYWHGASNKQHLLWHRILRQNNDSACHFLWSCMYTFNIYTIQHHFSMYIGMCRQSGCYVIGNNSVSFYLACFCLQVAVFVCTQNIAYVVFSYVPTSLRIFLALTLTMYLSVSDISGVSSCLSTCVWACHQLVGEYRHTIGLMLYTGNVLIFALLLVSDRYHYQ